MPTITTTVTSAQATGAVTTVTTTEATPEPAPASTGPAPDMFNGRFIQYSEWTFNNAADKATFIMTCQPLYAQMQNEGWAFIVDRDATSMYFTIVWNSGAAFARSEALFASMTVVQGMIGKGMTNKCYMAGHIDAGTKALFDKWDAAPGITMYFPEIAGNWQSIGEVMGPDGTGFFMTQAWASKADRDANTASMDPYAANVHASFATNIQFLVSDTETITVWMANSKHASMQWLQHVLKHPTITPILAEHLPKALGFGGHYFGNTADIADEMKAWETFEPRPILDGSFGRETLINVVNKWVYSTRAERDAALANADKIANCSGFTWCAFPVGEASMYIQAYAADYAVAYKKMAEAIGSCPEVLESLSQGLSGISFNVGSISNEWATDIENWKEALPCLAFPYETKQICNFDAGAAANYGPTGVTWFQDSVCNAPGQVEEWGVLFSQGPLHEAIREHGGSFTLYRTSALASFAVWNFPSEAAWNKFDPILGGHMETFNKWFKKSVCYGIGDVHTPAMKASKEAWNSSTWAEVHHVDKVYGVFPAGSSTL